MARDNLHGFRYGRHDRDRDPGYVFHVRYVLRAQDVRYVRELRGP